MTMPLTRTETLDSEALRQRLATDPRQAARILLDAAREGLVPAQTLLGQILLDGTGIERDPALARTWFRIAAEGGDAMARNMLGRCLEQGWGGEVDLTAAAREYHLAMASGLDWGYYNYAALLASGRGVEPDPAGAFQLYLKAAEMGHAKAMNFVGRFYDEGIGIAPSSEQARYWYQRSAEAGDFRGQFSHAAALADRGYLEEALHWLDKALAGGNLNFLRASRARLAQAQQPQIRALALPYHQRAAELGDDSDRRALADHVRNLLP